MVTNNDKNGNLVLTTGQPIEIKASKHVLIAGPTASGKSALALEIANRQGGTIVNADALQVFGGWRIVTARPDDHDLAQARHELYGHIPYDQDFSVGDWLRQVSALLNNDRLIIVGGTGLYLSALTEGLAEIPAIPSSVREIANNLTADDMIANLSSDVTERIDLANRARVQRAWEVQHHTGKSIVAWQEETPAPLLPISKSNTVLVDAPKEWLTPRIEKRFDIMLATGALDEAKAMLDTWDPKHASSKAIGAPELIAHLRGELPLEEAREAAIIASRQYAKRQRTWFRKRMSSWQRFDASSTDLSTGLHLIS